MVVCTAILMLTFFKADNLTLTQPFAIESPNHVMRIMKGMTSKNSLAALMRKGILGVTVHSVIPTEPFNCYEE
jgi:TRAP-type C4-dicarboxylate transport system substrate-binding protein